MKKMKLLTRVLCAILSVLMVVCIVPAITVSAEEDTDETIDYTTVSYKDEADRLAHMDRCFENQDYVLYCDKTLGIVAYQKKATGEVLFTNPWDMNKETNSDESVRNELMSQIILECADSDNSKTQMNSFTDAALKGQITVKDIKNGIRVEYVIGESSARILCPMLIERVAFEEKILKPLGENIPGGTSSRDYIKFKAYFNSFFYKEAKENGNMMADAYAMKYPITAEKNIDVYGYNITDGDRGRRFVESLILAYCPSYSFEEMDNDYDFVEYVEESRSPRVFKMALEYTIDQDGLSVSLPANGLRYDETSYRVTSLKMLPYMGASLKSNEGYSFVPDGSGTLYKLSQTVNSTSAVHLYGEDYALFTIGASHQQTARVPVFGQVEEIKTETGVVKRGYMAIVEEGDTLLTLTPSHLSYMDYTAVSPSFITRQSDHSASGWRVYACRRYTEDYRIRYTLLSDDTLARNANLSSYYECSWMGMACAYRDYLEKNVESYERLTDEDVKEDIPLYIESFGCVDTIKKVLSMPVTVSVALTSFENVQTMYDYLAGNGVENVNFKLTGFANGGLYSDVPYKLKWEKAVGGKSDFKELAKYAAEKGFGIYPDFDFVFTTNSDGGKAVSMKKNAARTIDNRYTSKRTYSATKQSLVSYYQMALSPATYSKFYEKLAKKYAKYEDAQGISLATLGDYLNSDFDENKSVLREESKQYVMEALSYFGDKGYDVMLSGGNAYTWAYADHIVNVPLDSSRYTTEKSAVPFVGVVLHGYVEFAGSPMNMEGNLSYAILKSIENGASAYFVLSYANTELLKEDELLSQNYSVRYDIWQNRLVEIYKELNRVLADVQTKLIINHEFLAGSRVPEADELLNDIAKEAQDKQNEIQALLDAKHLAEVKAIKESRQMASGAATQNASHINAIRLAIETLNNSKTNFSGSQGDFYTALQEYVASPDDAGVLRRLKDALENDVLAPFGNVETYRNEAEANVRKALAAYRYVKNVSAIDYVCNEVEQNAQSAIASYIEVVKAYYDCSSDLAANVAINQKKAELLNGQCTFADFKAVVVAQCGSLSAAQSVIDYFKTILIYNGLFDSANAEQSIINYDRLVEQEIPEEINVVAPDDKFVPVPEEVVVDETKYSLDNSVVLVTYGEKDAAFKSFLLNFNDYAVTTSVKINNTDVTYTIPAYGYVVIYH